MKFSLFSFVALAASAMAAPTTAGLRPPHAQQLRSDYPAVPVSPHHGGPHHAQQLRSRDYPVPAVPAAPAATNAGSVTEVVTSKTVVTKKISSVKVTNTGGVVKVLTIAVDEIKVQTTTIKETISKVKTGAISKAAAITLIHQIVVILNDLLTAVVIALKDVATIVVNLPDVKIILGLVIELLNLLVAVAKDILSILGLDNVLGAALELLFGTVATLLSLICELIGDIVPGLVGILASILNTLEGTLLAPVVEPVYTIFEGLTDYLTQGIAY